MEKEVALKVVKKSGSNKSRDAAMKEYEVLNKLSHQNIIKPITCFETSQEFVLVLPLMNCSLDEYLEMRDEPLSEFEVIKMIKMIVEGVDYAHKQ